jgi:hypothetical protein
LRNRPTVPLDHALAEARSLAFHQAVAARLTVDPAVLERARDRVARWQADGSVAAVYAEAWASLLSGDAQAVAAAICASGERVDALRHVTPFAGALDPRERWRIWREVWVALETRTLTQGERQR